MLAQCSLHGGPLKIPKGGKATRFPAREQKKIQVAISGNQGVMRKKEKLSVQK